MLKNYFKIAIRHLVKEKLYTAINLTGLALGIAVAILMFLFVKEEWSFDKFHAKSDRIYRVWVKEHFEGEVFFNTVTPFVLGRELADNFPEIEAVPRYLTGNYSVRQGELTGQEVVHLANTDFFKAFDFPMQEGDAVQAFQSLKQAIITPAMAQKYFGEERAIGKPLSIEVGGEWQQFQVGAIAKSPPTYSSIQFDIILPFDNVKTLVSERARNSWTNVYPETYVLLQEGQSINALEQKVKSHVDGLVAEIYKPGEYEVGFQLLEDIHLNNDIPAGIVPVSDGRYPYILGGVALLILILAGINFVTLAIGRSVGRAKEVGVRKVSGAKRGQLMQQFWSEAMVVSLVSVVLGLLLAVILMPYFNDLSGKTLAIHYTLGSIFGLMTFALVLGFLAGVYPALVTSGYAPKLAFQDAVSSLGSRKNFILRGLISFQFVLSVILIASTLIMQKQLAFIQNSNLGFDKEQMLTFAYNGTPTVDQKFSALYMEGIQKAELLKKELEANANVIGLATSSHALGVPGWMQLGYTDAQTQKFRQFYKLTADYDFLEMMDIQLESGRNFSKEVGADARTAIIINRTMANQYGIKEAEEQMPPPFEEFHLIGITQDFNYSSLHNEVEPLLINMDPIAINNVTSDANYGDYPLTKISIKLKGSDLPNTVNNIQAAWEKVAPEQPFDFAFVDDNLDNLYRSEMRLGQVLSLATLLAIIIACMGLFGMATLILARRTKEVGIRKVLGASFLDIILMLNRPFTWMVLIANLIGAPIAYYFMQSWLADFAYRTSISLLLFIMVGIAALLIAWAAVSVQAVRAALLNPVKALRYE
ncbi:MAG: ABC transporter permease [Saprospiraceae bacterium]